MSAVNGTATHCVGVELRHLPASEHVDADENFGHLSRVSPQKLRRSLQVRLPPAVVQQNAIANIEKVDILLVQLVLPLQLARVYDAVVPEHFAVRDRFVELLRELLGEENQHGDVVDRTLNVQEPPVEAAALRDRHQRSDGLVDALLGFQDLPEPLAAVGVLDDQSAQHEDAVPVSGVDPRQRRNRDEVVAEVAEVVDSRPELEAVVVPLGRPADEPANIPRCQRFSDARFTLTCHRGNCWPCRGTRTLSAECPHSPRTLAPLGGC